MLRMVEEMLARGGICVTYETVRQWGTATKSETTAIPGHIARLAENDCLKGCDDLD